MGFFQSYFILWRDQEDIFFFGFAIHLWCLERQLKQAVMAQTRANDWGGTRPRSRSSFDASIVRAVVFFGSRSLVAGSFLYIYIYMCNSLLHLYIYIYLIEKQKKKKRSSFILFAILCLVLSRATSQRIGSIIHFYPVLAWLSRPMVLDCYVRQHISLYCCLCAYTESTIERGTSLDWLLTDWNSMPAYLLMSSSSSQHIGTWWLTIVFMSFFFI